MNNLYQLILLTCLTLSSLVITQGNLIAQKMTCRTGHVNIQSSNAVSDIEADNYQVQSTLNKTTGEVSFVGLTKSFTLESGALDKAFNSQYVNVDGYSKFRYKGKLLNLDKINFEKAGEYEFDVIGDLTVGGIRIEPENVDQINNLLKERISEAINFEVLGVSRDINIGVLFNYR